MVETEYIFFGHYNISSDYYRIYEPNLFYFVILHGIEVVEIWRIHYFMDHSFFWCYLEFIVTLGC